MELAHAKPYSLEREIVRNDSRNRRVAMPLNSRMTFHHHNRFLTCSFSCMVAASGRPSDILAIIVRRTILPEVHRRPLPKTLREWKEKRVGRRRATTRLQTDFDVDRPFARN